ncbi:MAG: hypothetical protein D6743_03600 [Calditrichaeota bacterium]|nr:MAG: hypothetical protein D6743_03600 [Calditrichota bacterium]
MWHIQKENRLGQAGPFAIARNYKTEMKSSTKNFQTSGRSVPQFRKELKHRVITEKARKYCRVNQAAVRENRKPK